MIDFILGTAGHIDHGKTALVRALTGIDTDRLPEEKRRGITIELGFAELTLDGVRLGIVDVPGHERFVRQMLSGATGIDFAMLVVAADDSVKPQTREHLDILKLLGVRHGLIALTKCDLAAPDWMDLVEQEVRELVSDSFLAAAPLVRTSAHTGQGIDALKAALVEIVHRARGSLAIDFERTPFRLPIDRAFSLEGHGTIVTGSVVSGRVRAGETLVLHPQGIAVRVRGLHNHDRPTDEVHRGQRAAVNISGVRLEDLGRGHELGAPDTLRPTQRVTVLFEALPHLAKPIGQRKRLRLHLGTADEMAELRLLGVSELAAGETCFAQLRPRSAVVCSWNQPFVVRTESSERTIGGGRVLVPNAHRIRDLLPAHELHLRRLAAGTPLERASSAAYFAAYSGIVPRDLTWLAGITETENTIEELVRLKELVVIASPTGIKTYVHHEVIREAGEQILRRLEFTHVQEPLRAMFEISRVTTGLERLGNETFLATVLSHLVAEGLVQRKDYRIGLASKQPRLGPAQRKTLQAIVERLFQAGMEPPTIKELKAEHPKQLRDLDALLEIAVAEGDLVRVHRDFYLHGATEQRLRELVIAAFRAKPELTVSEIRESLGTSRKYAVPYCEYLDRIGITLRAGDIRRCPQAASSDG